MGDDLGRRRGLRAGRRSRAARHGRCREGRRRRRGRRRPSCRPPGRPAAPRPSARSLPLRSTAPFGPEGHRRRQARPLEGVERSRQVRPRRSSAAPPPRWRTAGRRRRRRARSARSPWRSTRNGSDRLSATETARPLRQLDGPLDGGEGPGRVEQVTLEVDARRRPARSARSTASTSITTPAPRFVAIVRRESAVTSTRHWPVATPPPCTAEHAPHTERRRGRARSRRRAGRRPTEPTKVGTAAERGERRRRCWRPSPRRPATQSAHELDDLGDPVAVDEGHRRRLDARRPRSCAASTWASRSTMAWPMHTTSVRWPLGGPSAAIDAGRRPSSGTSHDRSGSGPRHGLTFDVRDLEHRRNGLQAAPRRRPDALRAHARARPRTRRVSSATSASSSR